MTKYDFSGVRVLVIGDVMLDKYFFGSVGRISPEAPVPVVRVKNERSTLGGAGNVLSNIVNLGARAELISACGRDESADTARELLTALNAGYSFIERVYPTVTKLRVIGEKQQIVRLDFEENVSLGDAEAELLKRSAEKLLPECGAVILSDYGKGVCTEEVCRFVIEQAKKRNIPVVVDPKGHDWSRYYGADIVTPNVKELGEVAGFLVENTDDDVRKNALAVLEKYNLGCILVTRSHKGMSIVTKGSVKNIPTEAKEVFDVSGAGDTVVATLATAMAGGASLESAAFTANKAAGIVVSKVGTAPVMLHELNEESSRHSATELSDLLERVKVLRAAGKTIVFTNGCFDILHRGHVTYLREAKKLGDVLILGLNTDASVRKLKGDSRPVNNENDRAEVLCALESVDYVVKFAEDTPLELIGMIKPDVLVKGADYKIEEVVGREHAGKTVLIDFVNGYSTTSILEKTKGENQ
jgi:D-beta-D-heptose 7-phosphate kinase/D-beta-D-heptose 1-phosphate adenosyltransferase